MMRLETGVVMGLPLRETRIGALSSACGRRARFANAQALLAISDFRHAESRQRTHGSNPHPPGREPRSLHPLFPSALRMEKFIFFR